MVSNRLLSDSQRTMLFTTSVRFTPSTQTLKQNAVAKIVEQILANANKGLDINQIQQQITSLGLGFTITKVDLDIALKSVATEEKETIGDIATLIKYRLPQERFRNAHLAQTHAEANLLKVLEWLFENSAFSPMDYKDAFLYALAMIFYQLGSKNAHLVIGSEEEIDYPLLPDVIKQVATKFPQLHPPEIARIVEEFIRSKDPLFDEIKWNMAQNYYISVSLGLDANGVNLSRVMFENSRLYLDTNIAIAALEPIHPHHLGFQVLFRACNHLNIDLRVAVISLEELKRWLGYQHARLDDGVLEQISQSMGNRIEWLIYQIYASKKRDLGEDIVNENLLQSFENPQRDLPQKYDIHIEDDFWFDNARNLPNVKRFARRIQQNSSSKHSDPKSRETALHDAMLLYWIHNQRKEKPDQEIKLLTVDLNLPINVPEGATSKPLTITLDAMLQWLSPIVTEGDEIDFKIVFAELVRNKILPQDRFFGVDDFRIFAQLDMQCKNLPDEDVLGCIRYIKANAPNLNVTKADDREKLAHHIQKYFADPSREYKKDVEEYRQALGKANEDNELLKKEFGEEKQRLEMNYASQLDEKDTQIKQLEKEKRERQLQDIFAEQRRQIVNKLIKVFMSYLGWGVIIFFLAEAYGNGENTLQKISSLDTIVNAILGIHSVAVGIYITRVDLKIVGLLRGNDERTNTE